MSNNDSKENLLTLEIPSTVSHTATISVNDFNARPWLQWQQVPAWTYTSEQISQMLNCSITHGLSTQVAQQRLQRWGLNTFPTPHHSFFSVFKEEIKEPLIIMLLVVGLLYFIWGQLEEAVTVLVIIMICIFVEIGTEYKAKNALAKLSGSTHQPEVTVLRDGRRKHISAESVAVGDVMEINAGEKVVADGRLVNTTWLQIDESSLTGETEAVHKNANELLPSSTPLHLLHNMVMAETIVSEGHGSFIVTATGLNTTTGHIRDTVKKAWTPKTPLQKAMKKLAFQLTIVAATACLLVLATGFMKHLSYEDVILMTLSLAFATIPEELPILIKAVLAVGAVQLSKSHILVKSLKTAESLGGISVILTDKTGTLTYNTLTVRKYTILNSAPQERISIDTSPLLFTSLSNNTAYEPLLSAWLLSSPSLQQELQINRSENAGYEISGVRDRFDRALLLSCTQSSLEQRCSLIPQLDRLITQPNTSEVKQLLPFDSWRRRSGCLRTVTEGQYRLYSRGSTESLLEVSEFVQHHDGRIVELDAQQKSEILSQLEQMTSQGIRVLSFAMRPITKQQLKEEHVTLEGITDTHQKRISQFKTLESSMTFLGMVGFSDPVRDGVSTAIKELHTAGIVVKMVTGDHMQTGASIAEQIGIITDRNQVNHDRVPIESGAEHETPLQGITVQDNNNSNTLCYCRMTPDDKYNLVLQHQRRGDMVLVTGDGFNDGPALASADVGMAMGKGGTDMARAAAGLIITNDHFPSVVTAIKEGRRILDNLRKATRFYLACKLTLVLLFFLSLSIVSYIPMLPLHVILLECFMDLGASTAFTTEAADSNTMQKPPTQWNRKSFLSGRTFWPTILVCGLSMYAVVGSIFFVASQAVTENNDKVDVNVVQTMTFVAWLVSHVLLAASMRTFHRSILFDSVCSTINGPDSHLTLLSNPLLLVWTVAAIGFALLAITIAPLRSLIILSDLSLNLKYPLSNLSYPAYILPFLIPFLVYFLSEVIKFLYSKRQRSFANIP